MSNRIKDSLRNYYKTDKQIKQGEEKPWYPHSQYDLNDWITQVLSEADEDSYVSGECTYSVWMDRGLAIKEDESGQHHWLGGDFL